MTREYDNDHSQRLSEEGHPFFSKLAWAKKQDPEDLAVIHANDHNIHVQAEKRRKKVEDYADYLIGQLEKLGKNVEEYRVQLAKLKAIPSNAGKGNKGKTKDFAKMLKQICGKIGSTETPDVLQYWQQFDNQDEAEDNSRPHVWAVNNGSSFDYWYADEKDLEQPATINRISMAMTRLRKRESTPK